MTVPKCAVAVVDAARKWAPLFQLSRDMRGDRPEIAAIVKKRGGKEAVAKQVQEASDKLFKAVRDLEVALRKTPPVKHPRKPEQWARLFGFVGTVANAVSQAMQPKGIPPHVMDVHAEDVTDG